MEFLTWWVLKSKVFAQKSTEKLHDLIDIDIGEAANTQQNNTFLIYVSFIPFFVFGFWSLLATKLQKYYIIFVYFLQGKMGKTETNEKKIMQLKWPKYQKPKDENIGWTKHLSWYSWHLCCTYYA